MARHRKPVAHASRLRVGQRVEIRSMFDAPVIWTVVKVNGSWAVGTDGQGEYYIAESWFYGGGLGCVFSVDAQLVLF